MEEKRIFDLVLVKYGLFLVNCGNILVKSGRFIDFFGIDVQSLSWSACAGGEDKHPALAPCLLLGRQYHYGVDYSSRGTAISDLTASGPSRGTRISLCNTPFTSHCVSTPILRCLTLTTQPLELHTRWSLFGCTDLPAGPGGLRTQASVHGSELEELSSVLPPLPPTSPASPESQLPNCGRHPRKRWRDDLSVDLACGRNHFFPDFFRGKIQKNSKNTQILWGKCNLPGL